MLAGARFALDFQRNILLLNKTQFSKVGSHGFKTIELTSFAGTMDSCSFIYLEREMTVSLLMKVYQDIVEVVELLLKVLVS